MFILCTREHADIITTSGRPFGVFKRNIAPRPTRFVAVASATVFLGERVTTEIEIGLREVIAQHLKIRFDAVNIDMPIEKVGDSLELSKLVVAVEKRFGVALDNGAIGRLRVPRDLIPLVKEQLAGHSRR